MPPLPSEWSTQDRILVAHALLRTRWQKDLDDDRALELARGLAASENLPLADLLNQDAAKPPR